MNTSLLEKNLNEDNYGEYVDKIINIFRLSNKESSIILEINMIDYKAINKLSIISNNGEKQEFTDEVFKCDEDFFNNLIIVLINTLNERVKIVVKDILNEEDSDLVTFRMLTDNNDIFTITGLSKDDGNNLLKIVNDKETIPNNNIIPPNDKGVGSVLLFLFMIGVIIITFISTIIIFD